MKLLVVLGEGGHSTELLNLVDLLGDRYEYHYVISKQDKLSADQLRIEGPIYRLLRPRGKDTALALAVLRTIVTAFQALRVLLLVLPVRDPAIVPEHQDVRTRDPPATGTFG